MRIENLIIGSRAGPKSSQLVVVFSVYLVSAATKRQQFLSEVEEVVRLSCDKKCV